MHVRKNDNSTAENTHNSISFYRPCIQNTHQTPVIEAMHALLFGQSNVRHFRRWRGFALHLRMIATALLVAITCGCMQFCSASRSASLRLIDSIATSHITRRVQKLRGGSLNISDFSSSPHLGFYEPSQNLAYTSFPGVLQPASAHQHQHQQENVKGEQEDESVKQERIRNEVTRWYAETVGRMKACPGAQSISMAAMRERAEQQKATLAAEKIAAAAAARQAAAAASASEPSNEWVKEYERAVLDGKGAGESLNRALIEPQ